MELNLLCFALFKEVNKLLRDVEFFSPFKKQFLKLVGATILK